MHPSPDKAFSIQPNRRHFLAAGIAGSLTSAALSVNAVSGWVAEDSFDLSELTITDLQAGIKAGKYTSRSLAAKYLERIEAIDRKGPTRKIHNVEQVKALLARYDFETVYLEGMKVAEQIMLFQSAEFVIGVHGAGLANLLFCEPGTNVIELMRIAVGSPEACETAAARTGRSS